MSLENNQPNENKIKYDHIKSYVLRQARMSSAQLRAFEQFGPQWILPFQDAQLDFAKIFGNQQPVVLEIGFGMGHATAEIAAANPSINYVAAEVHKPGVGALIDRIMEKGLRNIRIIHHDVIPALQRMIPAHSLSGVHIFFPDPWQKKRHFKRRLIQLPFLRQLAEACQAGAYLYIATDWEDYAQWILETLSNSTDWKNPNAGFSNPIAWRPQTAFEKKGLDKEHTIREIYALRQ